MMKHIWIYAACLLGSPLAAETIGNVEFEFPLSRYEWKLMADEQSFNDFVSLADEDESEPYSENEEGEELNDHLAVKVFTHREGDALEVFFAQQMLDFDNDDDEEVETLITVQSEIDQSLNRFFPNHKFVIQAFSESKEGGFIEWEINDGIQDIMHGYTRAIIANETEAKRITVLSYFTTARATEHNRIMWAETLNQARIVE